MRQRLDTSERRTCKVVGLARSTCQYKAAPKPSDEDLRLALIRLAKQYGRYGYRKIAKLLTIEGWRVNHKKVERLWREEGLQLPHRHKRRKRLYHKDSSVIRLRPQYPNHIWSEDFVHDRLGNGRSYKMLTVLDEYTREVTKAGITPIQIYPGSPWENGYNERFNGTLRREILNAEWFSTIKQAKTVIGKWLRQYNHVRPHQALNMRPPVPETLQTSGP